MGIEQKKISQEKPRAFLSIEISADGQAIIMVEGCTMSLVDAIGLRASHDNVFMSLFTAGLNKAWSLRNTHQPPAVLGNFELEKRTN